jgi:GT2 family glycosyltransferase
MSKISIIVLTFNSIKFIKSCLDSVFNQDFQDFEVIVVDNSSKDGTVDFIKRNYLQVSLVENKKNLGAAKAKNQGIEVSRGKWILILDCDVILEKDFLKRIMSFVKEAGDSIGSFQPKVLNMDKKTIYSCGIYLSKLRRFYDIGKGKFDNGQFNISKYIFGACSAAALYKRQMLEEIKEDTGYFDERFFFLVEDVDLSWRAQRNGWKILYIPEAVCYHFGNSSGYDKKLRQYFCFRNRYFLILKNDNINVLKNISFVLLYDLPRLFYLMLTNSYIWKVPREIKSLILKTDKNYVNQDGI